MRKMLLLALAAALLCAPCAQAQQLYIEDVLTLDYPDSWLNLGEVEAYGESSYDLAFLAGPGDRDLNLSIYAIFCPDFSEIRLFDADEQTILDYADWMEGSMPGCERIEIRRVGRHGIPFVLLRIDDWTGETFFACSFANGWNLCLEAYAYADGRYEELRALDGADLMLFQRILGTLEPEVS